MTFGVVLPALLLSTSCDRRADVGPVVVSVIGDKPELAVSARRALSLPERVLTDAVAEGLVRFDAAGQIEGGLAERWTVTDDGTSYIFRLRNARWASGQPVRAGEIVTLLKRQLTRSDVAPYLTAISDVVEMTPEVIEVELARPRPDLLKLFAQPELALVRSASAGGAGPLHVVREGRHSLLLRPVVDPDRDPDNAGPTPEDDVRLIGEQAARAIVRFVNKAADLVTGGTIDDWPLVQRAEPAAANIRLDPAAGLFGLAVQRRDGFLADPANRAALSAAFDRAALVAAVSPEWSASEALLPDQLDSLSPPTRPGWATLPREQRLGAIRARVATWRAANGVPALGVALPDSLGGTMLWTRLAADLYAMGVRPVRLAADDPAADLRLIDKVAPYDSARWYLSEACVACSDEARAAIEDARLAPTLDARAATIARADAALTADTAYIPLARPFRWSLVALRLVQWQPNARAWHPLNHLRSDTR
ncbi:ABC transporter substrate-binding protein [Sphingomonas sp. HHU CXW]|uniref:ABC transporter substrate-binding protein n=1 Tax=Sphingomonas hominis TaxID=2741495 RepID=A0ABX2JE24_9SPHN|nr:ABC transporter substrate-binding protein [Sphingomonas hominis]NTS64417.1 ABC transporter substrate-binding protein [Sphingomonas hominis]